LCRKRDTRGSRICARKYNRAIGKSGLSEIPAAEGHIQIDDEGKNFRVMFHKDQNTTIPLPSYSCVWMRLHEDEIEKERSDTQSLAAEQGSECLQYFEDVSVVSRTD